jgi:hypothetical protein
MDATDNRFYRESPELKTEPPGIDKELSALAVICDELKTLDMKTTKRVLWYLNERFVLHPEIAERKQLETDSEPGHDAPR